MSYWDDVNDLVYWTRFAKELALSFATFGRSVGMQTPQRKQTLLDLVDHFVFDRTSSSSSLRQHLPIIQNAIRKRIQTFFAHSGDLEKHARTHPDSAVDDNQKRIWNLQMGLLLQHKHDDYVMELNRVYQAMEHYFRHTLQHSPNMLSALQSSWEVMKWDLYFKQAEKPGVSDFFAHQRTQAEYKKRGLTSLAINRQVGGAYRLVEDEEEKLGELILPVPLIPQMKESAMISPWQTLQGLDEIKDEIMDNLILPMFAEKYHDQEHTTYIRLPGMMLYGPPGTGKTQIVRSLVYYLITQAFQDFKDQRDETKGTQTGIDEPMRVHLFEFDPSNMESKWTGQGPRLVRRAFEIARDWGSGLYTGWNRYDGIKYAYLFNEPYEFEPADETDPVYQRWLHEDGDFESKKEELKKEWGGSPSKLQWLKGLTSGALMSLSGYAEFKGMTYASKPLATAGQVLATSTAQSVASKPTSSSSAPSIVTEEKPNKDRQKDVCILFMDEADALMGSRSQRKEGSDTEVLNTILAEVGNVSANKNLVILAATNLVSRVDSAIISRLNVSAFIDLPDDQAREEYIFSIICKTKMSIDCVDTPKEKKEFKGNNEPYARHFAKHLSALTGWKSPQAKNLVLDKFGRQGGLAVLHAEGASEIKSSSPKRLLSQDAVAPFGFSFRATQGVVVRFLNLMARKATIPIHHKWTDQKTALQTYIQYVFTLPTSSPMYWKRIAKKIAEKNIVSAVDQEEYLNILAETYPQYKNLTTATTPRVTQSQSQLAPSSSSSSKIIARQKRWMPD